MIFASITGLLFGVRLKAPSLPTTTTLFFHPKIYKKEKFIIIVQTMIGALAARNNLRVKNARQPGSCAPKFCKIVNFPSDTNQHKVP